MMLKKCTMCGRSLSRDNFGPDKRSPDRLRARCFDCRREEARVRYAKHRDAIRQREKARRERNIDAERRKARERYAADRLKFSLNAREYQRSEKGRAVRRATYLRQRARNPDAFRARCAVARALLSGKLKRQPCATCGAERADAHHHRGYARNHALDVIWLCKHCHIIEHGHKPLLTRRRDGTN